ncbi:hypothetical protein LTR95_011388 [Oleoguttula sp. CCFEE 5521]
MSRTLHVSASDVHEYYGIAAASLLIILLGWRVAAASSLAIQTLTCHCRKIMAQTLLMPRMQSSSDYSVITLTLIVGFLASNVIAVALFVGSNVQFRDRLRFIFLLNSVPLWASRRAPWIIESMIGIAAETYAVTHRILGWIIISLALQAATSSLFIRRRFFEVFLKLHSLFAIVTLGATWALAAKWDTVCKALATGLGMISFTVWLARLMWLNRVSSINNASLRTLYLYRDPDRGVIGATQLELRIARTLRICPGQYLNITMPSIPNNLLGYTQSHSYLVAWTESSPGDKEQVASMLVECRDGFSSRLRLSKPTAHVLFDGPYGHPLQLGVFDKVLFIASGIGIAAHLMAIRELLQAGSDLTARVRRIDLIWLLDTEGESILLQPMLKRLTYSRSM